MPRDLVIQKTLGVFSVALALILLSPAQIGHTMSVLGQGHFWGAYYYQWKAGKISWWWIASFAALSITLFLIAAAIDVAWLALGAGVLFLIHHFQDEVTLFGKNRSLYRLLEQLQPILLYLAFLIPSLFGGRFPAPIITCALILLVLYCFILVLRWHTPDVLSVYFLSIALALYILWFLDVMIESRLLLGSLVLFHYVVWYAHFYFRFTPHPARQFQYCIDMLVINALAVALFGITFFLEIAPLFNALFLIHAFYIWAIVHIIFSVRISDYRDSLRW